MRASVRGKINNAMFNIFGNNDGDGSLETFINQDGDFKIGMKIGENFGIDLDDGDSYMKIGDNFGIDI